MSQNEKQIIEVKNLIKKYKNKVVLNNINLNIITSSRIAIIGPNGSGKTTLCEVIAQLRKPTSGNVKIRSNIKIGMMLQESKYLPGFTGWDLARFYLKIYKLKTSVSSLQKLIYLLDAEKIIMQPITNLSGGQKQKINLLLALIVNPDLLILDEITTWLDIEVRDRIYKLLTEEIFPNKKLSIILVSHNMQEIERFCEQIIFMNNGEIVHTSNIKDILNSYTSIEKYVKEKFQVYKVGMYDQKNVEQYLTDSKKSKWARQWEKELEKKDNSDEEKKYDQKEK